ncbi:MAG: TolC family protein, partial [Deltaproteobacteria bacterium]|nr:TolC family protein [Deltaproteobacteria bacterium]
MSRYLKFLVFLLFWVLESVAPAAETVTLDELLQEVFQNNPDIRAAGYQVEAAR